MRTPDAHIERLSPEQLDALADRVEKCNQRVRELGKADLLNPISLMGDPLHSPSLDDPNARSFQVAVKVPEGVGICVWPMDTYLLDSVAGEEVLEKSAQQVFVPFDKLGVFEKGVVASVLEEIEEELIDVAAAAASLAEGGERIRLEDYLSQ